MFDHHDCEWVPDSLDTMEPGPVMASLLSAIDADLCTGYDRIRVLRAHQRMASHYAARTYQTMTSVLDVIEQDPNEADFSEQTAAAEIAAALRLTRQASDSELSFALELQRRLPRVSEALLVGDVDVRRARVIVDNTLHLSIADARGVVDTIIDDASLLTTGQLGAKLRKLRIDVNPDEATNRYRRAVKDRRIVTEATVTGTANLLCVDLPPDQLAAAMKRVNRIARGLRGGGETRTMDQLRADVLLDLLEGTEPVTRTGKGSVDLHTDLETLTGLADHPGDLAGYGPVIADIAKQIAEHQTDTEWRWTLNDPATGQAIAGGITRRRPTAKQRRHVQQRDRTCIHPGCRMPATNCDIDHRITWAESHQTRTKDLAALCRYHHIIRHHTGWTYQPLPDGDHQFTSALGHTYTTSGRSP